MKNKTLRFTVGSEYTLPEISSDTLSSELGWKYGYHFDKWQLSDGTQYDGGQSIVFKETSVDLSATWRPYEFTLQPISADHCTVTIIDSLGRRIEEGGTIIFDTKISVTAVPDEGYSVDKIHLQINSENNNKFIFKQAAAHTYYDQLSSNGQLNMYESTMISRRSNNNLGSRQFNTSSKTKADAPFGATNYTNTKAWLSVETYTNGYVTFWNGYDA